MTRIRTTASLLAASTLAAMLTAGAAVAQDGTKKPIQADQVKNRQIVVEDKAKKIEETAAPAAEGEADKAAATLKETPAKDAAATLTPEDTNEVAKAIEADKPAEKAVETPVEAPADEVIEAPVVKKVLRQKSKIVIIEQDGVFLKVRKYADGHYKVLGYADGYQAPSHSHDQNYYGGNDYYGGGSKHKGGYGGY